MCGIAGYFNTFNYDQRICSDLSNSVIDSIRKRGPDSHGTWNNSYHFIQGYRFLKINQPMISKNGRYILVLMEKFIILKLLKNYLQHQSIKSSGIENYTIIRKIWVEDTIKLLNGMFQ